MVVIGHRCPAFVGRLRLEIKLKNMFGFLQRTYADLYETALTTHFIFCSGLTRTKTDKSKAKKSSGLTRTFTEQVSHILQRTHTDKHRHSE